MSDITRSYKRKSVLLFILSLISTIGPFLIYIIIGFCRGEPSRKLALGFTIIISLILLVINIIAKKGLRSPLWIIIIGLNVCLNNIQTLLIVVALCTIIDEFMLTPAYKYYKQKAIINGEIDKR